MNIDDMTIPLSHQLQRFLAAHQIIDLRTNYLFFTNVSR